MNVHKKSLELARKLHISSIDFSIEVQISSFISFTISKLATNTIEQYRLLFVVIAIAILLSIYKPIEQTLTAKENEASKHFATIAKLIM